MHELSTPAKYAKCFCVGIKAAIEYRVNIVFSVAGAISPVIIQTALWIALYGNNAGATLFGFTFEQMVAYTVIGQLVNRLVRTGFEYDLNNDIKSGSLDRYLVKPLGYFGFRMFSFLGDKLVHSLVMGALLTAGVVILSVTLGFPVSALNVILFLAALFFAFVLNFLIFWCVGLAGFWLTDIGFLFEAARIVIITLAGGIFPIAVFGANAEKILLLLPFRFTIQFPSEILCGRISSARALDSFALAVLWIIILTLTSQFLWLRGLRRFAAVGS